ncbi:MAG: hypothetical protein MI757_01010 [Pirellulales bacterium]|nr:hypothetical protein [Pirellulales bacterium]
MPDPLTTAFASVSPRTARLILATTAIAIVVCVGISVSPMQSTNLNPDMDRPGDVDLYQAVIDRVHVGEAYYTALGDELRTRGYPTASVFNWRTPLPLWLIAKMPHPLVGKVVLGVLALLVLLGAFELVSREGGIRRGQLCGVVLVGALMPVALKNLYVMPTLWAGVLIALSLVAYGLGKRPAGIACAMFAWLCRDLAGLYCLTLLAMSLWQRRWKEALTWVGCIAIYAAFFAIHTLHFTAMTGPNDVGHAEGWLQFGGLPFIISIAQMNAFLLVMPQWVTAICLPLCVLGLASWNTVAGRLIAMVVFAYLAAFMAVGQMFNQYWGSLLAPALSFGIAFAPAAVRELWAASGWRLAALPHFRRRRILAER